MSSHNLIAGYDATEEAADGLALAHLLAERLGCELIVARVLTSDGNPVVTDPGRQQAIRGVVGETRRAIVAALPAEGDAEVMPVVDASVARGLHDLARVQEAEAIVVGSSHHRLLGRVLLGSGPEVVANSSPCPVFVAPPGFRDGGRLDVGDVTAAYDGTPSAREALRYAAGLAERLGTTLRIAAVTPTGLSRPIGGAPDVAAVLGEGRMLATQWSEGRLEVETRELRGDPARELAAEAGGGLLVVGSRGHGALRRVVLGSVSAAVLRAAQGPAVVVAAP